jgi:hypothetical protein
LLLALHAVRAARREEPTATLLAPTVASILATDRTANAVEQTGDEQTGGRGPHESECLDAQLGALAVTVKGIPTLDKDGAAE